ncbi:hypothetical protein CG709_19235, partial [Lachnotalea glycerini]
MPQNNEYWKNRYLQLEEAAHRNSLELVNVLENQYYKAQQEIEAKIAVWYQRFADNNNIFLVETRKFLNAEERKEPKGKVKADPK